MELLLILLVALIVLGTVGGVALSRRRGRGIELEPPPRRPPLTRPPEARRPTTTDEGAGTGTATAPPPATSPDVEAPTELSPEQIAEIEAALSVAEAEADAIAEPIPEPEPEPEPEVVAPVKPRFRDRLGRARALFADYVGSILGRGKIDEETWEELEEALVRADVGVATTGAILDDLRGKVKAEGITTPQELLDALKADLKTSLGDADRSLRYDPGAPNVWLFVGVNGVGKTTTIGKVGKQQAAEGRSVVMAAGDTFRAAAADQLELWAKRVGADLVRGSEGGDPASVIFDAVERSAARGVDLVLADTAGRLHTKVNLMEELKKVRRIAERPPARLTEVLLVIDATTGQNGLVQARQFAEAAGVTGIVLTKLDGTAKGGIVLAIQNDLGIPIKLVGLGETADDLIEFDPDEFVDALFE